jgi:CheY-like chemotaxis protein
MTALTLTLPLTNAVPSPVKKKKVLLVDMSPAKRDLRAEIMRKLGMDVDCAADIGEARSWWRADLYNLVLINVENDLGRRDRFCDDIRGATPPQQLAFLVGKPEYLADSPNADGAPSDQKDEQSALPDNVSLAPSLNLSDDVPQRWGILEASRRISAVRAAYHARSRAMRERPAPVRDSEAQRSKQTLDDLLRKEMQ